MPGFKINGGDANTEKSNVAEFRRKHRWRVTRGDSDPKNEDFIYLKSASRPSFKFSPAEFHHDQEKAFLAGKQEWDPIELVFYDSVGRGSDGPDITSVMYEWIKSVCNIDLAICSLPSQYKKTLIIQSTDAFGDALETWTLYGAWPVSSNWNNLDYSANDIQEVNISIQFDRALQT
jgi:hypothetical protein